MGKIFRRTAAALLIVASLLTAALVGAVHYAKIDPEGIYAFIKRDEKEKVTIVQQNTGLPAPMIIA